MADAVWQSHAMQALRPQCDASGAAESADGLWKLPDWEAYSESGGSDLSCRLDVSSCSSMRSRDDSDDGNGDSVFSFGGDDESTSSSEFVCRKRSPVSIGGSDRASTPKRASALQELHLRYARQRQQLEARAVRKDDVVGLRDDRNVTVQRRRQRQRGDDDEEAGRVSGEDSSDPDANRPPEAQRKEERAVGADPVGASQASTQSTHAAAVASDAQAIVMQQTTINRQLQAFRQQLSEMKQRKTRHTSNSSNDKEEAVKAPITTQSCDTSMQTDAEIRGDAIVQWLSLLTQKVELVAANYGHEATESFRATAEYLRDFDATAITSQAAADEKETSRAKWENDKSGRSSLWHAGGSLKMHLPQTMADHFLALERSLAGFNAAVETSSRRKLECFEQSIRQMQEYHHEKLQRVVDESLDELKHVRGKYKKTQDKFEEKLRIAVRSMEEWKQRAIEVEHKSTLECETIEFKAATFREKFAHLSVRFEEDIERIKQQLEQSRKEKEEALQSRTQLRIQEEALKKEVSTLQETLEVLQRTREQDAGVFKQEKQKWDDAMQQLHHSSDTAIHEIAKENQLLVQTMEQVNKKHALEVTALENRLNMAAEDNSQYTFTLEMVETLQRKHEAQVEALRAKYEHEIEEQGRAVANALEEVRASQKQSQSAETQTGEPSPFDDDVIGRSSRDIAEERIQELSRKCRALEKLLDKKFEQSSQSGAMSPLCMSCNSSELSRSAASCGKSEFLTTHAATSGSRAGARLKRSSPKSLSSSQRPFEDALFPDDDFDTTAANTTMMDLTLRNNSTWANSSMTSVDTMSPLQVLSRPQSVGRTGAGAGSGVTMSGVPSHADVLALVRKLENVAVLREDKSQNELESEQSVLYHTPPARSSSARNRKPPPIRQRDASAKRVPAKPLASKPLVLRGSSTASSPASSTPRRHTRLPRSDMITSRFVRLNSHSVLNAPVAPASAFANSPPQTHALLKLQQLSAPSPNRTQTLPMLLRALLPSHHRVSPLLSVRSISAAAAASTSQLLVINAGSSSLKYKMFALTGGAKGQGVGEPIFSGLVELSNASSKDGRIVHQCLETHTKQEVRLPLQTHRMALEEAVTRFFGAHKQGIQAIGHRVVHGGEAFHDATLIDDSVIAAITDNISLAPLHNPGNLLGIDVATEVFDAACPQVAVFDTAFHATMKPEAFVYAVPYSLYKEHGVRRYGFHGTSHQYVAQQAAKILNKPLEQVNLVTCHLGNGSSMAAIRGGKCIDTTMGLTPLEGLVMGTRSGDVDPALHAFLTSHLKMTIEQVDKLLNKQSGLLGVCGDSDIRKIQDRICNDKDPQADLAMNVYAHRVRKYLGAYLLELGGSADAIVFTAGIGENSAMIRERVCANLAALGIELDLDKNARSMLGAGPIEIQAPTSAVKVLVINTDEERSIAEQTYDIAFRK